MNAVMLPVDGGTMNYYMKDRALTVDGAEYSANSQETELPGASHTTARCDEAVEKLADIPEVVAPENLLAKAVVSGHLAREMLGIDSHDVE
jgi:hypothetical protein